MSLWKGPESHWIPAFAGMTGVKRVASGSAVLASPESRVPNGKLSTGRKARCSRAVATGSPAYSLNAP